MTRDRGESNIHNVPLLKQEEMLMYLYSYDPMGEHGSPHSGGGRAKARAGFATIARN